MSPQFLSSAYHGLQPLLRRLPLQWQVKLAAAGRRYYLQQFVALKVAPSYIPPAAMARQLWGINFRSGVYNAAGMFKNGEGYDVVARLGAGAYLGGTSTANPRLGNQKLGIALPFISLPKSKVALNYLGLPNYGDEVLATQVLTRQKISGCPIGWSVMRSPDFNEEEGLKQLLASLWRYHNHPQIDFIEINESCPNVQHSSSNLLLRLSQIAQQFLKQRQRSLPVIVKFSTDLEHAALPRIIESLVANGFAGINLGNTSTAYSELLDQIEPSERELFKYFTRQFGGGVSGHVLKAKSLELCSLAAECCARLQPNHEFHIIRSGGIEDYADFVAAQAAGVTMSQWYSGFFNAYARSGAAVYRDFFRE